MEIWGASALRVGMYVLLFSVLFSVTRSAQDLQGLRAVVTWLELIWTLSMLAMMLAWGFVLYTTVGQWISRTKDGENGILGLLLLKKGLLAGYKTWWAFVFGAIGFGFMMVGEGLEFAEQRAMLRVALGIAMMGWAVTGGLEAFADYKLEKQLIEKVDAKEAELQAQITTVAGQGETIRGQEATMKEQGQTIKDQRETIANG